MPPAKASSRHIEDLILQYRSGSVKAAEELLKIFHPLKGKYLKLFFSGSFRQNDQDILKFLQCCGFTKDYNYEKAAIILKNRLRCYEAEELTHICDVALLETAKKFVNISGSFKFVLLGYIKDLLGSEIHVVPMELSEKELLGHHLNKVSVPIDSSWINGDTAGDGFCLLSKQQRALIKLLWVDDVPDFHVRKALGLSPQALKEIKNEIKETLSKALNIHDK